MSEIMEKTHLTLRQGLISQFGGSANLGMNGKPLQQIVVKDIPVNIAQVLEFYRDLMI